jgi:RimJ/RimL family protein N-acetyltransferase
MSLGKVMRKDIVLTDSSVLLRPYCLSDADEVYKAILESLAELSPWLPFAHKDYSIKESRTWIKKKPGEWKNGIAYDFAIIDARDGSYLGGCGLNKIDRENRRANLGYWVRTSRTGQGVAPSATLLLAKWGFKELRLKRIEILVATGNKRSLRVAEKAGAQREGILRNRLLIRDKAHDAVMHSLIPQDLAKVRT